MMPVFPFQIALAVALALFFKASKITAALGTWISNPLNWYFIYMYEYKLGSYLMGVEGGNEIIASIKASVDPIDDIWIIWGKLFSSGIMLVSALLIGGIILGTIAAVPAYFIFLKIFWRVRIWRQRRKAKKAAKAVQRPVNVIDRQ
jgi:uncharacterized protein (DUF2062 family)